MLTKSLTVIIQQSVLLLSDNFNIIISIASTVCNHRQLMQSPNNWCHRYTRSALQHTATHCITLHHTATHCNTLQYTAPHCTTLHHTATQCHTLQHTPIADSRCNHTTLATITDMARSLWFISRRALLYHYCLQSQTLDTITEHLLQFIHAAHCNTLQHTATHCTTLQHTATHHNCRHSIQSPNTCYNHRHGAQPIIVIL